MAEEEPAKQSDQEAPMLALRIPLDRLVVDNHPDHPAPTHANAMFTANEAKQLALAVRKFISANRSYYRSLKPKKG
jgi:hypothetical protein